MFSFIFSLQVNAIPYITGWDCCCSRSRVTMGDGRPFNYGSHRDRRCPGLRAWAARERANPRSPTKVVGPEPASTRDDDGWPSTQPRQSAAGLSPNRRGQALLAAVRRGHNVAVVPLMLPASPMLSRHAWSFNAGAMVPPGLDPVTSRGRGTARRGWGGYGQDLAYAPGDDLPLRRPHTHSEAERWATTEELDRDSKTSPLH